MSILESRLLLSKKFRNILKNLDNKISKSILDTEGEYIEGDFTMIDIGIGANSEDILISFSTEKNILSRIPDSDLYFKGSEVNIPERLFKTNGRNTMRVGKFAQKVVKGFSDRDIEIFVNSIKSKLKQEGYTISIIDGADIARYYKRSACVKTSVGGTLLNSCMTDKDDNIFDIYTKNPDVCKMLIMTNTNGELVARALLWKAQIDNEESINKNRNNRNNTDKISLIPKESWLMDRVYYTEDWMQNSFFNYCEDNGYVYRKQSHAYFVYNSIEYYYLKFYVKVKKINYGSFPYLDTFSFYDVKNAMLSNYEGDNGFRLHGLNGNYTPTGGFFRRIKNIGINTIRSFIDYTDSE